MAQRVSTQIQIRRLLALGLVLASCVSCSKPSVGVLELQRSRLALRAAKSWQSGVSVQAASHWSLVLLEKVECPARHDRLSIIGGAQPGSLHELWFDGVYYKMEASGAWTAADVKFPMNCGAGPSLVWDGILFDDLDAVASDGEVRPGQSQQSGQSNADTCVWWDVAPAKGAQPHYSVCVDPTDHLPRTVRSNEHDQVYVYTFTNWNATSVTLPKDIVASHPGRYFPVVVATPALRSRSRACNASGECG
jgi:hypothetical protein